jgi:hypothetical protein
MIDDGQDDYRRARDRVVETCGNIVAWIDVQASLFRETGGLLMGKDAEALQGRATIAERRETILTTRERLRNANRLIASQLFGVELVLSVPYLLKKLDAGPIGDALNAQIGELGGDLSFTPTILLDLKASCVGQDIAASMTDLPMIGLALEQTEGSAGMLVVEMPIVAAPDGVWIGPGGWMRLCGFDVGWAEQAEVIANGLLAEKRLLNLELRKELPSVVDLQGRPTALFDTITSAGGVSLLGRSIAQRHDTIGFFQETQSLPSAVDLGIGYPAELVAPWLGQQIADLITQVAQQVITAFLVPGAAAFGVENLSARAPVFDPLVNEIRYPDVRCTLHLNVFTVAKPFEMDIVFGIDIDVGFAAKTRGKISVNLSRQPGLTNATATIKHQGGVWEPCASKHCTQMRDAAMAAIDNALPTTFRSISFNAPDGYEYSPRVYPGWLLLAASEV